MPEIAVEVPENVREEMRKTSEELGIDEEELVDRAIVMFIDSVRQREELEREFRAWDAASDEALESFEKSL